MRQDILSKTERVASLVVGLRPVGIAGDADSGVPRTDPQLDLASGQTCHCAPDIRRKMGRLIRGQGLALLAALSLLIQMIPGCASANEDLWPSLQSRGQLPRYQLDLVNHLSLKIAPSLGTQLYFPFILDQIDSFVPFTVNVTNSEVFLIRINEQRNFILISVPPDATTDEVGSLFIVVADRHINIRLGVGHRSEHTEAVYFTFSQTVRAELIDQAIEQVRVKLNQKLDERVAHARQQGRRAAIAYVAELAQQKPRRTNVHENFGGQHHRLYLQRVWEYPGFSIVFVEITPRNKLADGELRLKQLHLTVENAQRTNKYESYLRCRADDGKQICSAVFDQLLPWQEYDQIEIDIISNLGQDNFSF